MLLDNYLSSNLDNFTSEQIKILTGFKKKITSDFIIFKCLKKYAIFIDSKDNKFYAVKALGDRFDKFFDRFPVFIKTTILPYNDQIIYDGFITSYGFYFGSGMTSTMNDDYIEAKKSKQIQTII